MAAFGVGVVAGGKDCALTPWYNRGCTLAMKTAISIPDKLFLAADQFAHEHGFSRSQLFAEAVAQYLAQHPADRITERLDEVYGAGPARLDDSLARMQSSSLDQEEWE